MLPTDLPPSSTLGRFPAIQYASSWNPSLIPSMNGAQIRVGNDSKPCCKRPVPSRLSAHGPTAPRCNTSVHQVSSLGTPSLHAPTLHCNYYPQSLRRPLLRNTSRILSDISR